jgi:hypothetical protein
MKTANEKYQNYIYQFSYKGNVLVEPMKVSHGTLSSVGHRLNASALVQNTCPDLEPNMRRLVLSQEL